MIEACGGGQAVDRFDVILCAKHRVEARYADGRFTIIDAILGFRQFGFQPGRAGVKAQAVQRFAENVKFHAAIALLAVKAIAFLAIQEGGRHFNFKQRQRAANAAKIRLHPDFVLF